MFHTARWDYEYTGGNQREPVLDKLSDKRVAIVGTGVSAIQAVPFLADTPSSFTCFSAQLRPWTSASTLRTDESWLATLSLAGSANVR